MKIFVRNNDVNKAYRLLHKKLHEEGFFKDIREKTAYKTKSEKRREAKRAGRARWLKKRQQLEQKFIREERNQFRKKKPNTNRKKYPPKKEK